MRQIGTVPSELDAERLTDYLLARGIRTQVDGSNGVWAIWAFDEDRIEEARHDLAEYNAHPDDSRYADAHAAANQFRDEVQRQIRSRGKVVNLRDRWERPTALRRPVTLLLIFVSVIVSALTRLGQDDSENLLQKLTIARYEVIGHAVQYYNLREIRSGEVWRLFTPMFLHFSPMHIVFNMLMLYSLGSAIEYLRGSWRYAAMVLLIAGSQTMRNSGFTVRALAGCLVWTTGCSGICG